MQVTYYDTDELFPEEGWREPGDEASRLAVYILAVIGGLAGVAGAVFLGISAINPNRFFPTASDSLDSWRSMVLAVFALLCAALSIWCIVFLAKESRHWNLRGLTAERIVAGIFLLAVSVGIIAVWLMQGAGGEAVPASAIFLTLAVGLFLIALLVGFCVAGYQAFSARPRNLGSARILAKYAVDDNLQRIPDHPCPSEDGFTAIVELEFLTGELATFRAKPAAYDLARVNSVGQVIGARKTITSFRSERRP